MKRILHVVGRMNRGGAETLIMEWYRHIDRTQYQFDFVVHHADFGDYDDEIRALGGNIYVLPAPKPYQFYSYQKAWAHFFSVHPYDIVHGHMDSTAAFYLKEAQKAGTTMRIAHSHSTHADMGWKTWATNITHRNIKKYATVIAGCSEEACQWIVGKNTMGMHHVFTNGVDSDRFAFSQEKREDIRQSLGISPSMRVYGHVGRFDDVKNHTFLLDTFQQMYQNDQNARLLLIGEGPLRREMENKAQSLGLSDVIFFLGMQERVDYFLSAMDVFLLPSLYEGVPVSLIEAQASSLPCFVSTNVPHDVNILGTISFLPLDIGAEAWAHEIQEKTTTWERKNNASLIREKGYDIMTSTQQLQALYDQA